MRKTTVFAGVGIFALLLAVGSGLAWVKYRAIAKAAAGGPSFEPAESVEVVTVREIPFQATADLVGTVFSLRSVQVRNEIAGPVRSVGFESGAVIEQGAVLLTLDDATERADLRAAEASVTVANAAVVVGEARVRLAEQEVARMESAATDTRAVAPMEMDRTRSELEKARADRVRLVAEVGQAEAKVAQVQARLNKLTILAPFKARAGLRSVHEGQYLAEGASVVMLEEVAEQIYLDFAIPQEYVSRVSKGVAVMGSSEVLGPDPVRLEVVALDAMANLETRNIRVRSVLDNKRGTLRPGMFVQIRVPVDEPRPVVVVPATAIRRASFADQVFVVVAGEGPNTLRAKQRFVKLGPSMGDDVVVIEGLKAGEMVASTGSFKLRDGGLVTRVNGEAAKTASKAEPASTTEKR